ncbi:MAG: GGDEF domain-containing protein [Erythrobacter sp.]
MAAVDFDKGDKTMAFLRSHGLPPSPQNYTLAYIALFDSGSPVGRAIQQIVDEGYRIKQEEADAIFDRHGGAAIYGLTDRAQGERAAHLRHQTIKLGELASSAADATGAFARDLTEEADNLTGDSANALSIVGRMIEQSQEVQGRLTEAMQEVKELREELEAARNDAHRDELTGLANRRAIEAYLAELAEKGSPRIIALCDIDRFKSVNDRYGHGVGDRVIKLVAKTLEDICRPHFVGRWGGEEFIFVMSADNAEAGAKLIDHARHVLAGKEFKLRETDEPMGLISFSGGVALARGGADANRTALKHADDALYRAKSEGRNRVLLA